jgi:hypothetical protein
MQQPARLEGQEGAKAARAMSSAWCVTKRAMVTATKAMVMTVTRAMATATVLTWAMATAMRLGGEEEGDGKEDCNGEQQ